MKPFLSIFILLLLLLLFSPDFSSSELQSLLSLKHSIIDPSESLHDWTFPFPTTITTNDVDDDDVDYAGVQLHHNTTFTPTPPAYCTWSGIKCNPTTNKITSLNLSSRNLSGTIPPSIQHLTSILHLNLSHNSFTGPFPSYIFNLTSLQTLDINHNQFNSTFPTGISNLKSLTYLDCYSNSFTGLLPSDITGYLSLTHLNLGGSYFEGPIPDGFGNNLPNLIFLYLAGNYINGTIPISLSQLSQLQRMEIGYNGNLTGFIPSEFSQLSKLTYLDISSSDLTGSIPSLNLTSLQTLLLFNNRLSGSIPSTISYLQSLTTLDLSNNLLTGLIPSEITSLHNLTLISLMNNHLTGSIPSLISSLPSLKILHLWNNSLSGPLPSNLGLNSPLQKLDVSSNKLSGSIPLHLCHNSKLTKLLLFSNRFDSTIPTSLPKCSSLIRVRLQFNHLHGVIPFGFGSLPNLTYLDLSSNNFTGPIPSDIPNSITLGTLNLTSNSFHGYNLPSNIWKTRNLQVLSVSRSGLTGVIPSFIGCGNVYRVELSGNKFIGSIPWDIGDCVKLNSIDLSGNRLSGLIPWEISELKMITYVDFSRNMLSGSIPERIGNCSTLEDFNVSWNKLVGVVPAVFEHLHPSSLYGNVGLCGKLVGKNCRGQDDDDDDDVSVSDNTDSKRGRGSAVLWITAAVFGVGLFVLLAGIRCFQNNESNSGGSGSGFGFGFRSRRRFSNEISSSLPGPWKLTSFQRLNFTAEDVIDCLSTSDNKVIGMGSTGTVYKAELPTGETIAVKKLWSSRHQQKEHTTTTTAYRRVSNKGLVLAEVDVLGSVRHRNIVRLLGCCSNKETTMLLYEYMPNGSLDDLLHGGRKGDLLLNWSVKYGIVLGVAQGMCYLHHDCEKLIVHRDLKPSNILLDEEMEARVADFGVAKLVVKDDDDEQKCKVDMSVIAGSYGYIAPEYAYTLQVDEKSDIYSYGVILLEILTGKRSVDPEFGDGNSIVDWVRTKIKAGVGSILDTAVEMTVKEEMMLVLKVALICTSKNPADRPSMRDVVSMLQEARPQRKVVCDSGVENNGVKNHVIRMPNGCSGSNSMGYCSSSLEGTESVTC